MTFQQKLLLGFGLMVLPVLLVGAEAIRSNALERRALETLGESLSRTRTYSEVETAMFDQSEVIWRSLSGMEPRARQEFQLSSEVVDYWLDRWGSELQPRRARTRRWRAAHRDRDPYRGGQRVRARGPRTSAPRRTPSPSDS